MKTATRAKSNRKPPNNTATATAAGDGLPNDGMVTVRRAAEFLKISTRFIFKLIECDKLPSVKIGRSRRINVESLRRFAETGTATS